MSSPIRRDGLWRAVSLAFGNNPIWQLLAITRFRRRSRHLPHHRIAAEFGFLGAIGIVAFLFVHGDIMAWQSILEKHPEHVHLIGMIAIESGNLEIALATLFARMVMLPLRTGRAVYLTP